MNRLRRLKIWIGLLMVLLMLVPSMTAFADNPVYVLSISIKTKPKKLNYKVGEYVDLAGMVLNVVRRDDIHNKTTTIPVTDMSKVSANPSQLNTAGDVTVVISIVALGKKKTQTFKTNLKVHVEEEGDPPSGWTNSIKVTKKPKKVEYRVGDSFDSTGMVVTANQTNFGKKESVKLPSSFYTVSPTKFTDSGKIQVAVKAKLNDKNGNTKTFSDTVTVTVYDKIKITKSPKGEKVEEGGSCNFTAHANTYKTLEWFFTSGSSLVSAKDAPKVFPGLHVSGTSDEKLSLSNVPTELSGWKLYCEFSTPVETKKTDSCKITVTSSSGSGTEPNTFDDPDGPEDEPTEKPDSGDNTTTPLPVADKATPKPTEHAHSFAETYKSNDTQHWHECSCGERAYVENHIVTNWKTIRKATATEDGLETGICAVCGHVVQRTIAYDKPGGGVSDTALWVVGGIGGVVLLTVPPLLIASMVMRKKEKERKKAHKKAEKKEHKPSEEESESEE